MSSRFFGAQGPAKPHLAIHGETADLRNDVEAAFALMQAEAAKPTASLPATPFTGQSVWDITASAQKVWNGAAWVASVGAGGILAVDLASNANGKGARLVGIEDAAGKITATTVEGALAEIAAKSQFSAATSVTGDLTAAATVADLKPFITGIIAALAAHGIATDATT
jgi:hypothetical protein